MGNPPPPTDPSKAAPAKDAPRDAEKGRRKRPGPLAWIGSVIAVLFLAIVIFLALFNWDWFRPPLAKMLTARLHRPVRIVGHLKVHLLTWTPTVTLGGLEIGEPDWGPKPDLADVQMITVKLRLLSLLAGKIVLPLIEIDQPQVTMFQDKNGRANWDFSNGKHAGKPTKLPAIQNFIIKDGKLAITSLQRKLEFRGTVNAHDQTTGPGATQDGFHLGGTGQLNGKPFLMNVTGGPLLNVKPDVAYPFNARVQAGETVVTAKGRIPHPFNLGLIYADVSMSGRDLADLYYLTGVALPNTPRYSIAGHLVRDERVYRFERFTGRVGGSDLEGSLKADMSHDNRPDLTGALVSKRLDYKDLGALFGATGRNTPEKPHVALTKPPPPSSRRLLPDASLDASRIRAMDADVTYRAESVVASPSLPLRGVALGVKLDHGLLKLDPIRFDFPQGHMSGDATIDARHSVQRNAVDLRVSGVRLQNFLQAKGAKASVAPAPVEGTLDARARLTGDGDSVHKAAASSNGEVVAVIPGGVIRQAFAELLGINASKGLFELLNKDQHQTDIRCAVADFRVADGVLRAHSVVIDTGVVLVNGTGDINLNNETLDLSFAGKSKRFRFFHLDAPITIGGHLAAPVFGLKPAGAAVQAAAGAALGAVVFPPLALLPFIDPGLTKNADCTAVIQAAEQAGAPVKKSQIGPAAHTGAAHRR